MDEFIREHFGKIAAWSPSVLGVLVAVAGAAAWRLWTSGRTVWLKMVGGIAALSVLGFAVVGLFVAYGPMAPLVTNTNRLQRSIGDPFPDVSFHLVQDTSSIRLSTFKGKVVLLNLWATWCPPCVGELPTLSQLQTAYRDRGLVVVTLSDEAPAAIHAFVSQRSPDTVNGRVDSFAWLPIKDFRPFTLIIDRNGILRDYLFGDQTYGTFERRVLPYL